MLTGQVFWGSCACLAQLIGDTLHVLGNSIASLTMRLHWSAFVVPWTAAWLVLLILVLGHLLLWFGTSENALGPTLLGISPDMGWSPGYYQVWPGLDTIYDDGILPLRPNCIQPENQDVNFDAITKKIFLLLQGSFILFFDRHTNWHPMKIPFKWQTFSKFPFFVLLFVVLVLGFHCCEQTQRPWQVFKKNN